LFNTYLKTFILIYKLQDLQKKEYFPPRPLSYSLNDLLI
jgi:hypothetical protein